jgi:uncharacterized protein
MRILVAGGTGFIGRVLIRQLSAQGNEIVALARDVAGSAGIFPPEVRVDRWDGVAVGEWRLFVEDADAVINLSGASIGGGRWTPRRKALLLQSRLAPTRALVEAMRLSRRRPRVFINASAVGYYGMSGENVVTEESPPGDDFLGATCRAWEAEALSAAPLGVRVVLPRFGVVLAEGGGALDRMVLPFRLFLGGPLGSGDQWYPWVHRDDAIAAMHYLLERHDLEGGFNVVSPESVTMRTFSRELGRALGRPSWMPVPSFALRVLFGEMSGIILQGRHIVPTRLLEAGFRFTHPTLRGALHAILG